MSAADTRARIEAELARFKAEVSRSREPALGSAESRRAKVEPIVRSGCAVEQEVRANVEAVATSVQARARTVHTVSQCPRFDRWLEARAHAEPSDRSTR